MARKLTLTAVLLLSLFMDAMAQAGSTDVIVPQTVAVGKAAYVKIETDVELPASSFFRVEAACPVRPQGADVKVLAGFPETDLRFSMPGHYECEAEAGIVTKSSCAAVTYRKLASRKFVINVTP